MSHILPGFDLRQRRHRAAKIKAKEKRAADDGSPKAGSADTHE
jgi:hypothetical protein